MPRSLPTLVAVAVIACALAACDLVSTSPPPAGPDDFSGITGRWAARGITIRNVVSGDSGCDDLALGRTAIRFEASGRDQDRAALFYLYIFRNRSAFERLREAVGTCATAYVTDPGAPAPMAISPYVLVTPDALQPGFVDALREGLQEAAGSGG